MGSPVLLVKGHTTSIRYLRPIGIVENESGRMTVSLGGYYKVRFHATKLIIGRTDRKNFEVIIRMTSQPLGMIDLYVLMEMQDSGAVKAITWNPAETGVCLSPEVTQEYAIQSIYENLSPDDRCIEER
jgi:phage replication-related protein YjqB (UPF0714/DUF867 family)